MADQKISQLASGTNAQAGDLFVIARGATNLSLTTAQLFNAPSATATLGGLNVDSGTLFVDATNNRVGVGTASPVSNLHLLGVASANADFSHETVSAGTSARTRYLRNGVVQFLAGLGAFSGNDTYEIAGASGPFITLNTSGNLGLGVTPNAWLSPFRAMQIGTGNGALALAGRTDNGGDAFIGRNVYYGGSPADFRYVAAGTATRYRWDGAVHQWSVAASGSQDAAITFTNAMTLDASGRLLVGQTSDAGAYRVVLSGDGVTYVAGLKLQSGSTDTLYLGNISAANSTDIEMWNPRNGYLRFATNNTERARITAAGSFVAGAQAALATTATDGFLYVPTCAGTPTGTPTAITGMAPIVVNTTNNKLYFYSGGAWRDAGP